jgi:two-component system LytT family sensor kinase
MNNSWVYKRSGKVLVHTFAWLIVFSLPYLLRYNNDDFIRRNPDSQSFMYVSLLTGFFWIITFYLNARILIPRLLYKKKYLLHALLLVPVFIVILLFHWQVFEWLITSREYSLPVATAYNLPTFVLTIAASTAYKVLNDNMRNEKLMQAKQEENLKTELSFLRSQISPHFVFNVLNNITALARMKSDALEPTIIKLSSLLRYMLYETNEDKVSLQTETEYLQSYIDLQQQRFGKRLLIDISLDTTGAAALEIEPMLLIPFVENAFKHGFGLVPDPEIRIGLSVSQNTLQFSVSNKYMEAGNEQKDKTSGIGLANVKRRLNLLYGKDHALQITRADGWYLVSLQLKLH